MIDDALALGPALLVGAVVGTVFFAGLWWTVRMAVRSRWVALWFLFSLVVRGALVVLGLLLVCGDDWRRWLAGLLGFTIARAIVTRVTREQTPEIVVAGAGHAP